MEMWFSEFHTPDVKHSIRVNRQLYSKQSDYQRIDIFETPEFGRVLTLDGNVMLTERDEFIYDEMITHVPMSVHKNAKDILVIGAGDGGVNRSDGIGLRDGDARGRRRIDRDEPHGGEPRGDGGRRRKHRAAAVLPICCRFFGERNPNGANGFGDDVGCDDGREPHVCVRLKRHDRKQRGAR